MAFSVVLACASYTHRTLIVERSSRRTGLRWKRNDTFCTKVMIDVTYMTKARGSLQPAAFCSSICLVIRIQFTLVFSGLTSNRAHLSTLLSVATFPRVFNFAVVSDASHEQMKYASRSLLTYLHYCNASASSQSNQCGSYMTLSGINNTTHIDGAT